MLLMVIGPYSHTSARARVCVRERERQRDRDRDRDRQADRQKDRQQQRQRDRNMQTDWLLSQREWRWTRCKKQQHKFLAYSTKVEIHHSLVRSRSLNV